jgi:hypothetical protein
MKRADSWLVVKIGVIQSGTNNKLLIHGWNTNYAQNAIMTPRPLEGAS